MSAGRVGMYLHQNGLKGGALVKVTTQTDFAARTDEVAEFCSFLAQRSYGAQSTSTGDLFEMFPEVEAALVELQSKIGEKVVIETILITNV